MGTPTASEVSEMNAEYENKDFPEFKAESIRVKFKELDRDAVDLLSKMLKYSPKERY